MMSLKRIPRDRKVVEVYDQVPKMLDLMREKVFVLEQSNRDDTFFVVDFDEINQRLVEWKEMMPRVEPFYALKCNNDAGIARFIADLGLGFDCASQREIQQILDLGVHPDRIVYANPCKPSTHLRYANEKGVNLMTFDGVLELDKIKKFNPNAKLLLRIFSSKDFKAGHNFNKKFGCHPKQVKPLLERAQELGLNVIGVSFHVGSLPEEVDCFSSTIEDARDVFDQAKAMGFNFTMLDIGGGYPGHDSQAVTFEQVAKTVTEALDTYFPSSSGVKIIAEPGRYFVTSAFTLAVNVIAKRVVDRDDEDIKKESESSPNQPANVENDDKLHMYYINDGVYGAFNNVMTDYAVVYPMLLSAPNKTRKLWSCIWGPTCDGLDSVVPEGPLPEMDVDQWIYFHHMGAYTVSLSCDFNGISRPSIYYICSEALWNKVYSQFPAEMDSDSMSQEIDSSSEEKECYRSTRSAKAIYRLTLSKGE